VSIFNVAAPSIVPPKVIFPNVLPEIVLFPVRFIGEPIRRVVFVV